ncbi:MAG: hypothetical protein RBR40_13775 [Tenuifilaceae bacterium]|jgi:hypothetical protein|nr:hypothetical protein [Tenuifilaceae bacterium]
MKKKVIVVIITTTILLISTISMVSARAYFKERVETGEVPNKCGTTQNTECYEGADKWACHPFGCAGNCSKN